MTFVSFRWLELLLLIMTTIAVLSALLASGFYLWLVLSGRYRRHRRMYHEYLEHKAKVRRFLRGGSHYEH